MNVMPTLLHVAVSPCAGESHSRQAPKELTQGVKTRTSELSIVLRDLVETAVPHVNAAFVSASLTAPSQRDRDHHLAIALSEVLIDARCRRCSSTARPATVSLSATQTTSWTELAA
jgi:FMN-dependent NADH-azoreductase